MSKGFSKQPFRVLVIGPRRGLIDALQQQQIPYAVWQERALLQLPDAEFVITAPLYHSSETIKKEALRHFNGQTFTHVIAGTENAVLSATVTRRLVGARLSRNTTVSRCRDKLHMKEYLSEFDIPMTKFLNPSSEMNVNEVFDYLGTPVVKKKRKSSGGKGVSFINDANTLSLDDSGLYLLEKFVSAPEASIESFISHGEIQFTNITQYYQKGHINFIPCDFCESTNEAIKSLNQRVIEALNIQWGITHLEVYLTEQGPLLGEIALRPPGGYIMNAMQYAYEFNPWQAFLAMELGQTFNFPQRLTHYCAVEVCHPGDGTVQGIVGADILAQHPTMNECRIKIKVGDVVSERKGVGQDTGYFIYSCSSSEQRLKTHLYFKDAFCIEMAR